MIMTEQNIFSLWPQIQTELFVFLGRPSVQLQLALVLIGLVAANLIGRVVQRRWHIRYQQWSAEGSAFVKKLMAQLFRQLTSGFLAFALIYIAKTILHGQGARTALIDSLLRWRLFLPLTLRGSGSIKKHSSCRSSSPSSGCRCWLSFSPAGVWGICPFLTCLIIPSLYMPFS